MVIATKKILSRCNSGISIRHPIGTKILRRVVQTVVTRSLNTKSNLKAMKMDNLEITDVLEYDFYFHADLIVHVDPLEFSKQELEMINKNILKKHGFFENVMFDLFYQTGCLYYKLNFGIDDDAVKRASPNLRKRFIHMTKNEIIAHANCPLESINKFRIVRKDSMDSNGSDESNENE